MFDIFWENRDIWLNAWWRTVVICFWGIIGSLILGTLIAVCRVSPTPPLRWFGTWWVTTFRNMPLTLVFFFIAFGLPTIGVNGSYFVFALVALWIYTSAFVCEAIRSGINSVQPGQAEAARAIGLTFTQTLSLVILPQAFRAIIPPLGSVLIAMMKNSATAGFFGVPGDLSNTADSLIVGQGYNALPVMLIALIGWWLITLPAAGLLGWYEKKLEIAR